MAHTTQTVFMHACVKVSISLFPLMFTLHIPSWAQDKDRSKIPVDFTWDLSHIYPTDDAWKEEKDRVVREIPTIEQYKGKLGSSAASLLGCMEKMSFIGRHLVERLVEDRQALGWDQLKKMLLYFLLMRGSVPQEALFPRLMATPWFMDPIRRYLGGDPEARCNQIMDEFLQRGLVALVAGAYRPTLRA